MSEKEKNGGGTPDDMGGIPYDGIVDIEEVITDGEIYEIDETE